MLTTAGMLASMSRGQNILQMLAFLNLGAFLWPKDPDIPGSNLTVDFIIVGGGTAGCIIAAELVKNKASVALFEAGPRPPFESQLPGLFEYFRNSPMDWNFTATYDANSDDSQIGLVNHIQQGKILGGSGQMDYMLHGFGHKQDYDDWATIVNDSSWRLKELCPLIKRLERLEDKYVLNSPNKVFHGTEGKVRIKKYHTKINCPYFESYKELGYDVLVDINPNNTIGFTNAYFTIGKGGRQSTFYTFLRPERLNPKLHVIYNSLVTKIIFDENKNAVGVRALTNERKHFTVNARKEVIITAGVIKSPQLLMLSGIGPKNHLKSKGIKVISDLPVGQNFRAQPSRILIYGMGDARPAPPPSPYEFPVSIMEGHVAINKTQKRPDYHIFGAAITDPKFFLQVCRVVFALKNYICDRIYKIVSGREVFFVAHNLLRSESRGEILLNSTNPEENPIIIPRYYSNNTDLKQHAKYVRHFNGILNTTYFKSVNATLAVPHLEMCDEMKNYPNNYEECLFRALSSTLNNYGGSCSMGSVVNPQFQVIGVKRLRVADASVMPVPVGSSFLGPVSLIAQKAADLLSSIYKL